MVGLIGLALLVPGHGGPPRSALAAARSAGCGSTRTARSRSGIVLLVVAAVGQRLDGESPARELALPALGRARHAARRRRSARAPRARLPARAAAAPGAAQPGHRVAGADLRHDEPAALRPAARAGRSCCSLAARRTGRALIVGVFSGAALLGARNLVVASLVMLPVMARGPDGRRAAVVHATGPEPPGSSAWPAWPSSLLLTVARLDQPDLELGRYPVGAVAYLEEIGIDTRRSTWPALDFVGNLIDFVYGPEQRTFYDDRFDMFPDDVVRQAAPQALGPGRRRRRIARQRARPAFDIDLVDRAPSTPTVLRPAGAEAGLDVTSTPRALAAPLALASATDGRWDRLLPRRCEGGGPAGGPPARRRCWSRGARTRTVRCSARDAGPDAKKGGPCGPPFFNVLSSTSCWRRRWRCRSS